jgi:hypothetical protein
MMRHWVACLLLPVLAGCGAPTVSIPRAEFAIARGDIKATVAVFMYRVKQGCEQKRLSQDLCKDTVRIEDGLALLDEQAKAIIRQADREPDWATISKYMELAIGLAMKAAI